MSLTLIASPIVTNCDKDSLNIDRLRDIIGGKVSGAISAITFSRIVTHCYVGIVYMYLMITHGAKWF